MPSTYSALKFQLMATGENAGTWGNVTNVNLGTAIEEAIAGSTDVTFASADVTLTLTDTNSSQPARHMRLNLTGTTGGVRDLIVPAVEKLYVVNNACADAITVKVFGQTGIAVPAGRTMFVYNNGVDVVDAITHLTSLTVNTLVANSPAFTGTPTAPTASSGTNTTQIATTAFVTAALQAAYPVGSIYMNATNSANPSSILGFGTWTAFGAGRMPVGFNASDPLFDTAEETGGSKDAIVVSHTHTASTNTVADHQHAVAGGTYAGANTGTLSGTETLKVGDAQGGNMNQYSLYGTADAATLGLTGAAGSHSHSVTVTSEGSSGTNANLPPYITVYMWKRTA